MGLGSRVCLLLQWRSSKLLELELFRFPSSGFTVQGTDRELYRTVQLSIREQRLRSNVKQTFVSLNSRPRVIKKKKKSRAPMRADEAARFPDVRFQYFDRSRISRRTLVLTSKALARVHMEPHFDFRCLLLGPKQSAIQPPT